MEENNTGSATHITKYLIPAAVLVVIVIAAIGYYISTNQSTSTQNSAQNNQQEASVSSTPSDSMSVAVYKDGTYSATGNYVSPGGPRDIGLTVTVKNDVITNAVFEGRATDATSKRFQGEFGDNFKPMVVGKNISDVVLTKVSGSSLTPKGFNDALKKIKQEAKVS